MEPILDPNYWTTRLDNAHELHHSIFRCPLDRWRRIEEKHREILARTIGNADSILDCGCGYGRLLNLLPPTWQGQYLGIDICPAFIEQAQSKFPARHFALHDLRCLNFDALKFDWAVCISIRPMVIRNLGQDVWDVMNSEVKQRSSKTLFLEYDENCNGFTE